MCAVRGRGSIYSRIDAKSGQFLFTADRIQKQAIYETVLLF